VLLRNEQAEEQFFQEEKSSEKRRDESKEDTIKPLEGAFLARVWVCAQHHGVLRQEESPLWVAQAIFRAV
jgi:hypothetical protein